MFSRIYKIGKIITEKPHSNEMFEMSTYSKSNNIMIIKAINKYIRYRADDGNTSAFITACMHGEDNKK